MLLDLGADVELPDLEAAQRYRDKTANETDRGALRDIAAWLAGVQGTDEPHAPSRVKVVRIASDVSAGVPSAIARGASIADDEVERGTDLLVLTVAHHDVTAEAIIAVVTNTEPVKVLPRGATLDADEWMRRATGSAVSPEALLRATGKALETTAAR